MEGCGRSRGGGRRARCGRRARPRARARATCRAVPRLRAPYPARVPQGGADAGGLPAPARDGREAPAASDVAAVPAADAVRATGIPRLSLLAATPDLAGAAMELPREAGSEQRLRGALAPL